jgi:hypothetical protein
MSISTTRSRTPSRAPSRVRATSATVPVLLLGAVLSLAVAGIHVLDQGGLTALKDPSYVGYGYRVLEVLAVVAAVLLVARRAAAGWFLAAGVAAGPLLGYVISRSVGLPGYTEDIGNWAEPIGLLSLLVEGLLLLLAAWAFSGAVARRP